MFSKTIIVSLILGVLYVNAMTAHVAREPATEPELQVREPRRYPKHASQFVSHKPIGARSDDLFSREPQVGDFQDLMARINLQASKREPKSARKKMEDKMAKLGQLPKREPKSARKNMEEKMAKLGQLPKREPKSARKKMEQKMANLGRLPSHPKREPKSTRTVTDGKLAKSAQLPSHPKRDPGFEHER